jgi:tRNA pseudouridine55 synthase|tara:strand:- start:9040 stop:9972 length:933 start_codon:yes stop_codon:yes gene_type:complete
LNKPAVKRREINGILILDKGIGKSSNGALQEVKRLYNAKKAGHTGSLDPLATGVLPLCFGEATKFSQFLLDANKRYVTTIKLGVVTTTGDAEGEIVEEVATQGFSTEELESALEKFRGEIEQIPSMFSAIKVNGQPLYKLARQGIEIERKSRVVTIFELNLVENNGDELILDVSCSKGTYIRTLAEDLGKVLGCGAHVIALRRTQSGPFKLDEAYSLQALEEMKASGEFEAIDSLLLSPAAAVVDWPSVELTALSASYLKQGQAVQIAKAPTTGWVSIFSESEDTLVEFLGVGEITEDGRVAPRRLVATQ